ncbi:MAG: hypothetical protein LPK11_03420 [Chromatiaceae bacterium]|nr:hypothetical protein [Chromatiaceae bacterium]
MKAGILPSNNIVKLNMKNRGRIQAQGEALEESESWSTDQRFDKRSGICLLSSLKAKLKKHDLNLRTNEFDKVEKYINNSPKTTGVSAQVSKTYRVKNTRSERVDIEVRRGTAFED